MVNLHSRESYESPDLDQYTTEASADLVKRVAYMICVGIAAVAYVFMREYCCMRTCSKCNKKSATEAQEKSALVDAAALLDEDRRMKAEGNADKLQVHELSKIYPGAQKFSLLQVSFGIKPGEVLGYIGANGAGKSTTLNLISGRILATSGDVRLNNEMLTTRNIVQIRQHLGYCTQTDNLFPDLTVFQHLRLFAMIHGHEQPQNTAETLMRLIQLEDYRNVVSVQLSGGNKRKLMIALTLLGSADVVVLDEPSSGMDPLAQRFLWDTILYAKEQTGASFLLTSHSFEEVQALCDRVALLIEGQMRFIGSIPKLTNKYGTSYRIALKLESGVTAERCLAAIRPLFPAEALGKAKFV